LSINANLKKGPRLRLSEEIELLENSKKGGRKGLWNNERCKVKRENN